MLIFFFFLINRNSIFNLEQSKVLKESDSEENSIPENIMPITGNTVYPQILVVIDYETFL